MEETIRRVEKRNRLDTLDTLVRSNLLACSSQRPECHSNFAEEATGDELLELPPSLGKGQKKGEINANSDRYTLSAANLR